MSDATKLKDKLSKRKFIVAPGVQDLMTATLADHLGFEIIYATGYWLTASAYGLPDAGIATYTQMHDRVETLTRRCKATLIADGDTGYGGLLNVRETVKGYEQCGVAAIQLEDQEFPKTCGQEGAKKIISTDEMVQKIHVAVNTRDEMLVIARCDARQTEGFDAMIHRLQAYSDAGADIVLPEAVTGEDELRQCVKRLTAPIMVNMAHGGATPVMHPSNLADIGCALAIYPSLAPLSALAAMESALLALKGGTAFGGGMPGLYDFKKFGSLIGLDDIKDFDKKWAMADSKNSN